MKIKGLKKRGKPSKKEWHIEKVNQKGIQTGIIRFYFYRGHKKHVLNTTGYTIILSKDENKNGWRLIRWNRGTTFKVKGEEVYKTKKELIKRVEEITGLKWREFLKRMKEVDW